MHTDPISDMLTRIRNAQMVKKSEVVLPYSKLKLNILRLLTREGWLGKIDKLPPGSGHQIDGNKPKKAIKKNVMGRFDSIKVELKYDNRGNSKITNLRRISKPGRRVYVKYDEIKAVLNGFGMAIISTSRGMMTDREARSAKAGGEIICEIY